MVVLARAVPGLFFVRYKKVQASVNIRRLPRVPRVPTLFPDIRVMFLFSSFGGCLSPASMPGFFLEGRAAGEEDGPAQAADGSGSLTVKVVPVPTWLSTVRMPPCRSTIWRVMFRPMPVPGMPTAVLARKNFSNSRGIS